MRGKVAFGLGVLAVLVVCAALPANAFAEEPPAPYWAECFKTSVKHTGKYEEKKCVKLSGSGTGNYELRAGIGHGGGFTGKATQEPPELEMQTASGLIEVDCKKSTDSGKYALPNRLLDVVFTYNKCHGSGSLSAQACTSPGASAGTIQLSPLSGELGYRYYEKGSSVVLVGALLGDEADPPGFITHFNCGPELEVRISGQLMANTLANAEATKEFGLSGHPKAKLGELEYNGKRYTPVTNELGWEGELHEIELGERPPHVLVDELCGPYVQRVEGESCTPPLYMGVDYIFKAKGEALRIVKYEGEEE